MATSSQTKSKVSRSFSRNELIEAMEMGAIALKTVGLGAKKMGVMSEVSMMDNSSRILIEEAQYQKNWRESMADNKRK